MKKQQIIFSFFFCVCFCLLCCSTISGQEKTDSIRTYTLSEVGVKAIYRPSKTANSSPTQVLGKEDLEKLNVLQVSDAVKFFSGVQVKDYGGVGGLKTVSMRSLGAAHSGVSYDGINVMDFQTGQLDLGKFSLNNVEIISLTIGESDDIFSSARTQTTAGTLNIRTQKPVLPLDKKTSINVGINAGSWNFLNPYFVYDQWMDKIFSANISGEWTQTDGDYPYTSGSGEEKRREHSDLKNLKLETNIYGNFNNGGKISFKCYGYNSDRSLPGADIFHETYPGELVKEQNIFSQLKYEQDLSSHFKFQSAAKFDFTGTDYTNLNNTSASNNYQYYQREYYLTTTFLYHIGNFSTSFANDGSYANFDQSFSNKKPSRTMWQSALSAKYQRSQLTLTSSLSSTYSIDESQSENSSKELFDLSPYIGISIKPFRNLAWRIRSFYKQSFRQPTFGDLYSYSFIDRDLKAEKAEQFNAGITWSGSGGNLFPYISFTADAYKNHIDNKIVARPTSSMYIWTVENYGKVEIQGIDLKTDVHRYLSKDFSYQLQVSYTYQDVRDKTNPAASSYNLQIPYTPHHSGGGNFSIITPWLNINYTILYCGKRYYKEIDLPEFILDGYADQSISLNKNIRWNKVNFGLSAECLNFLDQQYEVVRSYPMPGRSFRIGIKISY